MNSINHVAIIMDGNGRWGLKRNKSRNYGHKAGLKSIEKIIKVTIKKKIPYLTLFAFSTENWKRPKNEVNFLLNLLESFLKSKIEELDSHKIKLKIIGDKKKFPKKIKKIIEHSEHKTKKNENLQINLAINYGSKSEITNTVLKVLKNKIKINEININKNLYTNKIPDPDILIRTGNTRRLSNFLLWQIAYSEIFFEKKLWPDFNENDYTKILNKFKKTKRNFGNI